jgi:hypothetical protein
MCSHRPDGNGRQRVDHAAHLPTPTILDATVRENVGWHVAAEESLTTSPAKPDFSLLPNREALCAGEAENE